MFYKYIAMTGLGQEVKKVVEANSFEDAIIKIRELGEYPVKIDPSVMRMTLRTVGRKIKTHRTSLVGAGLILLIVLVVAIIMNYSKAKDL